MTYVLGIDIGTSYTAAAVSRREHQIFLPPQVMNLGGRGGTMPSVIFMNNDGELSMGEIAVRRGVHNPGRMIREFKRRMGDPVPVVVADTSYPAEDLFALMVRWIVTQAEEREGESPESLTVTHPVGWGEYRISLIEEALVRVGLQGTNLLSEPEAAALHYASHERVKDGSTIAVYDLGGGTFDAAVLRKVSDQEFCFLGTPVGIERLGGADFDQLMFHHAVNNTPGLLASLSAADADNSSSILRLQRECTEAKEALSFDSETDISLLLPASETHVRIVRSEFEEMISDPINTSIDALHEVLRTADLEADDLDAILLVGGSSRIPLVAQMLSTAFSRPIAIDTDPKASICMGAAFAAAALIEVADDDDDRQQSVSSELPGAAGTAAHARRIPGERFVRRNPPKAEIRTSSRTRSAVIVAAAAVLIALTATAAQTPTDTAALTGGSGSSQGKGAETESGDVEGSRGSVPRVASDEPSSDGSPEDLTTPPMIASSPSVGGLGETWNDEFADVQSSSGVDSDTAELDQDEKESPAVGTQEKSPDPGLTPEQATSGPSTTDSAPSPDPVQSPEPSRNPIPDPSPGPSLSPSPEVSLDPSPSPSPAPSPEPTPSPTPDPSPEPSQSSEESVDPASLSNAGPGPSIDPVSGSEPTPMTTDSVEPVIDISNASAMSAVPLLK